MILALLAYVTKWWSYNITIWLFNIAMENCPFVDGLPIKMVIFHGYVK
jgi:hypothetical protein